MLKRFFDAFRVVDASLRSAYGNGFSRYFKFLYISFFRINVYEVLCVETKTYVSETAELDLHQWDLDTLRAYREGKSLPREFYMDVLKKLRTPWVVLMEGEVAYIVWKVEKEHSRFLEIGAREVELSYSLTLPEYRRRGLHKRAFSTLIRRLGREGCERVFAVVHNGNVNSLRALRSVGMKSQGQIIGIGRLVFKRKTAEIPARGN